MLQRTRCRLGSRVCRVYQSILDFSPEIVWDAGKPAPLWGWVGNLRVERMKEGKGRHETVMVSRILDLILDK